MGQPTVTMKRLVSSAELAHTCSTQRLCNLSSLAKSSDNTTPPLAIPSAQPSPWVVDVLFTEVVEGEHDNSTEQQTSEKACAKVRLHRPEDVEEISRLQWHCQGPVNVSVPNWRLLDAHPVFAHVEVMHRSDESGNQPLPALCDRNQDESHLAIPIPKPIHGLTMRYTQR